MMVQTETDRRMGLNLNLSIYSLTKPLSQFLDEVSKINDVDSKVSEIDGYVGKLEEEMKKIVVFKRELPLCMLLLNEAIEALKEEARKGSVVSDDGERAKSESESKKNWMSSAQLWISNPNSQFQSANEEVSTCNYTNQTGAFLPFTPPPAPPLPPVPAPVSVPAPPPLSLMTPMDCNGIEHHHHLKQPLSSNGGGHYIQKKEQRRRWSQELHRKFVDALHKLGGSQVATPKQIRDMMQVDGLTNDEVKSHLQKYRMHIRKHPLHPAKPLSTSDQQSLISLSRSRSPQSPLVERGLFSSNNVGGHSSDGEDEEEEKSDGRSWKNELSKNKKQRVVQGLDLEL